MTDRLSVNSDIDHGDRCPLCRSRWDEWERLLEGEYEFGSLEWLAKRRADIKTDGQK